VTDELPEKRKRIFQMSRFDGLNTTEIAEELSLSKKTVENQLHIALKYVRSKIERSELGTLLFLALFLSH
jgi:RNA polymerase sigma-70 factor (ECF subfamily)